MRRARLLAILTAPFLVVASALPTASRAGDPLPYEMESYQLVLLVRAPTYQKLPKEEAEALQARHLAHLTAMAESGKMVIAGPLSNQPDPALRGACLYRVATPEEARALAEQDPVVKAGQLRVDVMTWSVGKGYMTFPRAPAAK
jgi:uncharacterized protein YciI